MRRWRGTDPHSDDDPRQAVHDAISGLLDDGEIAVAWTLTIDAVGHDHTRRLAYCAGSGVDGTDDPTAWHALGMFEAGAQIARAQVTAMTASDAPGREDSDDD